MNDFSEPNVPLEQPTCPECSGTGCCNCLTPPHCGCPKPTKDRPTKDRAAETATEIGEALSRFRKEQPNGLSEVDVVTDILRQRDERATHEALAAVDAHLLKLVDTIPTDTGDLEFSSSLMNIRKQLQSLTVNGTSLTERDQNFYADLANRIRKAATDRETFPKVIGDALETYAAGVRKRYIKELLKDPTGGATVDAMRLQAQESDEVKRLRKALKEVNTALVDWLNVHLPEECGEERVKEARKRIYDAGGTAAYIGGLNVKTRQALKDTEGK